MNREPEIQKPVVSPIPYFSTTMRDGFSVPMRQALFTAGLSGGGAFTAVLLLAWFGVPIDPPLKFAAGAFLVVFFPVALITWQRAKTHWMYIIEMAMLQDLNQDGVIGDPAKLQPAEPKLKVTVNNGKQRPEERDEIEVDELPFPDRLPQLARALADGRPFTYQEWGGPGKLFSQPEWVTLTDALRKKGYIVYRNPNAKNQGFDFTHKGGTFLQGLLEEGARIEKELSTLSPTPSWNRA